MVNTICCAQTFEGLYSSDESRYKDYCAIVNDTIIYVHCSNEGLMRYFGYIGPIDSNQWQQSNTKNCLYAYNAYLDISPYNSDSILFTYELPHGEAFSHYMFLTKDSDTLYLENCTYVVQSGEESFLSPLFYLNMERENEIKSWLNTPIVLHTHSIMSCSQLQTSISKGLKYTVKFKYADDFISNDLHVKKLEYANSGASITIFFDAEENDLKKELWHQESRETLSSVEDYIKLITDCHEKDVSQKNN